MTVLQTFKFGKYRTLNMGQRIETTLRETISFRTTTKTRDFLEEYASERGIGICKAARELLSMGIAEAIRRDVDGQELEIASRFEKNHERETWW